jgi:hypothetical protein
VVITVTTLAGPDAVISGLCFDPPSSVTSAAIVSLVNQGSTTQGDSIGGAYGNPIMIEIGTVDFSGSDSRAPVLATSTVTANASGPTLSGTTLVARPLVPWRAPVDR